MGLGREKGWGRKVSCLTGSPGWLRDRELPTEMEESGTKASFVLSPGLEGGSGLLRILTWPQGRLRRLREEGHGFYSEVKGGGTSRTWGIRHGR